MTDHAFAAPVEWAITPFQLDHAASVESRGTGSHVHFNAPVRASKPRTSPLAAFVRETVWPVILCVMICFMAYRLIGFLYRTLSGVMSGFQLTLSMPRWVYALDEILKSRKSRNPV